MSAAQPRKRRNIKPPKEKRGTDRAGRNLAKRERRERLLEARRRRKREEERQSEQEHALD